MARRKRSSFKRDIGVDHRFGSERVQKLINIVMWRGKKNVARDIVYEALDVLVKKADGDNKKGLVLFNQAFENIVPRIEVRSRRVGGSVYQIPVEVRGKRGDSLAMRWLLSTAATRSDKTMGQRLAKELLEAVDGRGNAIKKKNDVHKMAEANRAFAHYAW